MSTVGERLALSTEPEIRREAQGWEVTKRTLASLQEREQQSPGVVSSTIVFFRHCYNPKQKDLLRSLERGQAHREYRHAIAMRSAEVTQQGVCDWLRADQASVRECFAGCPHFQFDPRRHVHRLPVTNALVISATSRLVERIWEDNNVLMVHEDFLIPSVPDDTRAPLDIVRLLASGGSPAHHKNRYTWGWDLLGLKSIHEAGYTGAGIRLGIANTGVYENHADLVFKVKDFAKVQLPATVQPAHCFDNDGHGTHCAGIMVGANNSGVQIGGAPDAELVAVSVLDGAKGWAGALLAGVEWFVDTYRSVSVVNLSLGIEHLSPDKVWLFEHVFSQAELMNVLCVAAVGNNPSMSLYPARLKNVLACGALDSKGNVWDRSGKNPDLVLPGESVYSSLPPGHPALDGQDYGWFNGTSSATAHLSALVALVMQARPAAGPRLVGEALKATGSRANAPDARWGCGIPDFWRALAYIDEYLR